MIISGTILTKSAQTDQTGLRVVAYRFRNSGPLKLKETKSGKKGRFRMDVKLTKPKSDLKKLFLRVYEGDIKLLETKPGDITNPQEIVLKLGEKIPVRDTPNPNVVIGRDPLDNPKVVTETDTDPETSSDNPELILVGDPDPEAGREGGINLPTGPEGNGQGQYTVTGIVSNPEGDPEGTEVKVIRITIDQSFEIGQSLLDVDGNYTVTFVHQEECPPDIRVLVMDNQQEIARSEDHFNIDFEYEIDVVTGDGEYKGPSNYTFIFRRVTKCVPEQLLTGILSPAQREYIVGKTEIDEYDIKAFIAAFAAKGITGGPSEYFFALFYKDVGRKIRELVRTRAAVLKKALEDSVEENLIPESFAAGIDAFIINLNAYAVSKALSAPTTGDVTSIPHLFTIIGLPAAEHQILLTQYLSLGKDKEAFWTALQNHPVPGLADNLKLGIKLAVLTFNHKPALEILMGDAGTQGISDVRAFARYGKTQFISMFQGMSSQPDAVPGTGQAQVELFAESVYRSLERSFPSQNIIGELTRDPIRSGWLMTSFLSGKLDFDFVTANIDDEVAQFNGTATQKETLTADLKKWQRLVQVGPKTDSFNAVVALEDQGIGSALEIIRYGRNTFHKNFITVLGEQGVEVVIANAEHITAATGNLAVTYLTSQAETLPFAISGGDNQALHANRSNTSALPNLSELFGTQGYCSCKHCRSVYSAAGYLADLLHFLDDSFVIDEAASTHEDIVYTSETGLEVLSLRRSEVREYLLNCKNTNTVLPYIDLVNEILEEAVAPLGVARQTTWATEELAANPEHVNGSAYSALQDAVFPFSLPFNLWNKEAEIYLGHSNVTRLQLINTFRFRGTVNEPGLAELFGSPLHLTTIDREILLDSTTVNGVTLNRRDYWGMSTGTYNESLSEVLTFEKRAGLNYAEIQLLLQVDFVNPGKRDPLQNEIKVSFENAEVPCDLENAKLAYWDDSASNFLTGAVIKNDFHRIQQFLRLKQLSDFGILELGFVFEGLLGSSIDTLFLQKVAVIRHFSEKQHLSVSEILAWWAPISTGKDENDEEARSLYESIFLNKAVLNPVEEDLALNAAGDALAVEGTGTYLLEDYVSSLSASLELSGNDANRLLDYLVQEDATNGMNLSFVNLSHLYRISSLSKALGMEIQDFLIFLELSEDDPFDQTSPASLLSFVETTEQLQVRNWSPREIAYVMFGTYESTDQLAPTDEQATKNLESLQEDLEKIADSYDRGSEPAESILGEFLIKVLEEEDVEEAFTILEGEDLPTTDEEERLFFFLGDYSIPAYTPSPSNTEERFEEVLTALLVYLRELESEVTVVQGISNFLGIDQDTSNLLINELVDIPEVSGTPSIEAFLPETFWNVGGEVTTDEAFEQALGTYYYLHRCAHLISKFKFSNEEVAWIFSRAADKGWVDLNNLDPLSTTALDHFSATLILWEVLNALPPGDVTVFDLIDAADDPTLIDTEGWTEVEDYIAGSSEWTTTDLEYLILLNGLANLGGWDIDSLYFLASSDRYGLALSDFTDEAVYFQFIQVLALEGKLGMTVSKIWNLTDLDLEESEAKDVIAGVKSKYPTHRWLEIAKELRDQVREAQRDALVSYLLHYYTDEDFEDTLDIYEYFLVDSEMSACTMTSRIKLALSSVQLFIQRCMMNLEEKLVDIDEDQYAWMKNYRVWEANRKVFLYPENWIEPELRTEKSEFFEELEAGLLQNDVNDESIEREFRNYLEKVESVSNIQIVGQYYQYEAGEGITEELVDDTTIDIMHVFGRTVGLPYIYYYRRWEKQKTWTPWEKVDTDVEGAHLIPKVINRQLFLFWPVFKEKTGNVVDILSEGGVEELATLSGTIGEHDEQFTYYDIHLAWSEYKHGKWTPKKQSEESVNTNITLTAWAVVQMQARENPKEDVVIHSEESSETIYFRVRQRVAWATVDSRYHQGTFIFRLANKKVTIDDDYYSGSVYLPDTQSLNYNNFQRTSRLGLDLLIGETDGDGNYVDNKETVEVLSTTVSGFQVPIPHQYDQFVSQTPFFFEDEVRSFFVTPYKTVNIDYKRSPFEQGGWEDNMDSLVEDDEPGVGIFMEATPTDKYWEDIAGLAGQTSGNARIGGRKGKGTRSSGELQGEPLNLARMVEENDFTDMQEDHLDYQQMETVLNIITKYKFFNFYHPYIPKFFKNLNRDEIEGVLERDGQWLDDVEYFESKYYPTDLVGLPYPKEEVDFSHKGAFSIYNWEIFFHAPMLVADHLSRNRKYEEAQAWYHYIFNPTDRSNYDSPQKYWQFKPFFDLYEDESISSFSIQNMLYALSYDGDNAELLDLKEEVVDQIESWRDNPFDPHVIAVMRPVAYMKAVVMKYLDNLIEWGDNQYRMDTIESNNEATQLYVLAARILGKRPEEVEVEQSEDRSYNDLGTLDDFSNALVEIENYYGSIETAFADAGEGGDIVPRTLYFCVPNNPKLDDYWDLVEDRLFKLRNCMNIEGIVRQLPLFQPPIDPALLVRAAASGIDIGSVLNDLYAPLPHYRFEFLVRKAIEVAQDLKSLGGQMLSAQEKRDGEKLALLRNSQELALNNSSEEIRKWQLDEGRESLASLKGKKKMLESRLSHYEGMKNEGLLKGERTSLDFMDTAIILDGVANISKMASSIAAFVPDVDAGLTGIQPTLATGYGGSKIAYGADMFGDGMTMLSNVFRGLSTRLSQKAGYTRREQDWNLQISLSKKEIDMAEAEITAAEIRVAILERERENHQKRRDQVKEISEFMQDKFTNEELYSWMIGQLSTVYYQSYQTAYDLAKQAQKAFTYELGQDASFISYGYWENLRKGLLSGDKLLYDLRNLESAYLESNKRHLEVRKQVSLAFIDPVSLTQLKETGTTYFSVPDVLFDLDFPGHYFRRIKSVSLTIPCVTGPYTSVSAELTLISSTYQGEPSLDPSATTSTTPGVTAIATSSADNDTGVFRFDFNDARYLPFEGAGVASEWKLTLPSEFRSFDYNTISDVILNINYQSKNGGETYKEEVNAQITTALADVVLESGGNGLRRSISVKREFSNQWYRFLHPEEGAISQSMVLNLSTSRFHYLFRDKTITIDQIELIVFADELVKGEAISLTLTHASEASESVALSADAEVGGHSRGSSVASLAESAGEWTIAIDDTDIPSNWALGSPTEGFDPDLLEDLVVVVHYTVT